MNPEQQKQVEQVAQGFAAILAIVAIVFVWQWLDDAGDSAKAGLMNAHQSITEFEAGMDDTCAGSASSFCKGWQRGRAD